MQITERFRDKILFAMPELSQQDARMIAALEGCSAVTVYTHWRKLKALEGEVSTIHICLAELAISKKKESKKKSHKLLRLQKQLSAA
jgi:hypothetical protein